MILRRENGERISEWTKNVHLPDDVVVEDVVTEDAVQVKTFDVLSEVQEKR